MDISKRNAVRIVSFTVAGGGGGGLAWVCLR